MDNQNTNHNKNGSNKDDSQINIKRVEFDRSSRVNQKKSNGKWKNILQTTIRSMMVKDEEEGEEAAKKRVKGSSVTQIAKGAVAIGVITGGVTATQMTAFASDGEMVAEVHQGTTVAGEHEVTIEEAPAEQSSGQEVVETVVEQEIGSGTETTASASATSSEEVGQSEVLLPNRTVVAQRVAAFRLLIADHRALRIAIPFPRACRAPIRILQKNRSLTAYPLQNRNLTVYQLRIRNRFVCPKKNPIRFVCLKMLPVPHRKVLLQRNRIPQVFRIPKPSRPAFRNPVQIHPAFRISARTL